MAKSLSNLGALYRDIGDYSSARNCFDQALAIRKQALGLKHPATIGTLYNLGNLLTRTKDYEQAPPIWSNRSHFARKFLAPNIQ